MLKSAPDILLSSLSFSSFKSVAITLAPASAKASAHALPMPWAAAVIKTTFPFSLLAMSNANEETNCGGDSLVVS